MKHLFVVLTVLALSAISASANEKWSGDASLGYLQTNGNTKKSSLNGSASAKRMFEGAELSAKVNIYNSTSDKTMDSQTWDALLRYSFDFGETNRWFNSYQIGVDHDRFADIDYRITPAAGIGYWLYKEEGFKWMVETSFGYEITEYRSSKDQDSSAVAILHTNVEKSVFKDAKLSEDLSIIPSLGDGGTRIKSTTELTNPLTDSLDLSLKYILDHDTEPSPDKKKTDTKIITGIKYSF